MQSSEIRFESNMKGGKAHGLVLDWYLQRNYSDIGIRHTFTITSG